MAIYKAPHLRSCTNTNYVKLDANKFYILNNELLLAYTILYEHLDFSDYKTRMFLTKIYYYIVRNLYNNKIDTSYKLVRRLFNVLHLYSPAIDNINDAKNKINELISIYKSNDFMVDAATSYTQSIAKLNDNLLINPILKGNNKCRSNELIELVSNFFLKMLYLMKYILNPDDYYNSLYIIYRNNKRLIKNEDLIVPIGCNNNSNNKLDITYSELKLYINIINKISKSYSEYTNYLSDLEYFIDNLFNYPYQKYLINIFLKLYPDLYCCNEENLAFNCIEIIKSLVGVYKRNIFIQDKCSGIIDKNNYHLDDRCFSILCNKEHLNIVESSIDINLYNEINIIECVNTYKLHMPNLSMYISNLLLKMLSFMRNILTKQYKLINKFDFTEKSTYVASNYYGSCQSLIY
jgi:hypothetical protein